MPGANESATAGWSDAITTISLQQGHGPSQGHGRGGFEGQSAKFVIFKVILECQVSGEGHRGAVVLGAGWRRHSLGHGTLGAMGHCRAIDVKE